MTVTEPSSSFSTPAPQMTFALGGRDLFTISAVWFTHIEKTGTSKPTFVGLIKYDKKKCLLVGKRV